MATTIIYGLQTYSFVTKTAASVCFYLHADTYTKLASFWYMEITENYSSLRESAVDSLTTLINLIQ